jgi:hypothetical protein
VISAPDVSYFAPAQEQRPEGLSALTGLYESIRTEIRCSTPPRLSCGHHERMLKIVLALADIRRPSMPGYPEIPGNMRTLLPSQELSPRNAGIASTARCHATFYAFWETAVERAVFDKPRERDVVIK